MFSNEVVAEDWEYVVRLAMRPRENPLFQVWENIHDILLFNALLMMESVNNP